MKRTLILSITISIVWQLAALAHTAATKDDSKSEAARTRAAELISKAREAIGGDAKLKSLQGLYASGTYRRVLGDREMSGEVEYEIMLPDHIRRTETLSPVPGMEITRVDVLNGTQVWSDSQTGGGGGGGMVMIRQAGGENPQAQTAYEAAVRADFARQMLGLLVTTIPTIPLTLSYVGEAEAPDGRADVIDVSGPEKLAGQFFLDQKSHRPLMLSYKGRLPRVVMRTFDGPAGHKDDIEKRTKEIEKDASDAAPREVEMQISYEDYRNVGGIELPHRMTRSSAGKVTEQVEFKKFKLNPPLKPSNFEKK